MGGIAVLVVTLYLGHLRVQAEVLGHLQSFYWSPGSGSGLLEFLSVNLGKEAEYFAPFGMDPYVALGIFGLLALTVAGCVVFRKAGLPELPSAFAPLLVATLAAGLVALAMVGKYPFGGLFRQQSILAPFVFLTAFVGLDRGIDLLRVTGVRRVVMVGVAAMIAGSFWYGWSAYPRGSAEPGAAEWATFERNFPVPEVVYGDQFSIILYLAAQHSGKWHLERRMLVDGQRLGTYLVTDATGHPTRVLRNKPQWSLELETAETYRTLADALRQAGLRKAVLFHVAMEPPLGEAAARAMEAHMRSLASAAGLNWGKSVFDRHVAFVEFSLP